MIIHRMRPPASGALLTLIGLLLLTSCQKVELPPETDQSVRPARIFKINASGLTLRHQFVGRIKAAQTIDTSFEVSGPLISLPFREGQTVKTGQVIAAIDPKDFLLSLRESQVQLKLARQDLDRKQKLVKKRVIAQSVLDDSLALYDLRSVQLDKTKEALADTRMIAPFNGYVTKRFVDPNVNLRAGDKVLRLSDLSQLFVVTSIPEKLFATVAQDRVVGVNAEFAFAPGMSFPLLYKENTGEADSVAQTYEVTFSMPRPEGLNILPGMTTSVNVELTAEANSGVQINIPTTALQADPEKQFFVWVLDAETQAVEKRMVKIGAAVGNGIPVLAGLRNGELVVATGASQLQPGMRVRILGEPMTDI